METIPYGSFTKIDLRVARVIAAEPVPGKDRIMHGVIDTGGEKIDVIIGGAQYYTPAEMVGKTVIAVVNLEPKTVAGVRSNAMLLAADVDGKPFWLRTDGDVRPGSRVM